MSRIDKPITFAEADKALARRQDRETYLKSREIAAQWSAEARSRAFFSARVANATILSELHSKAQAIAQGKMTQQQAKLLLRRYFVGEGAKPLAALGFAPADEAGGVGELGSAQRINLILETNVRMAQEVGQYRKWAEDRDIYKYGIWRVGWSKEHRPEHLARDGRAYAFDHPIWTESPPGGEFNCHCYRQLARESEVLEKGITPEPQASYFEPSSLGFDPSRGMREPPEFGNRVRKEYKDMAKKQMNLFRQVEETVRKSDKESIPAIIDRIKGSVKDSYIIKAIKRIQEDKEEERKYPPGL